MVVLVKEKPKAVRDCQKIYVDYGCKSLEFEVGDRVLLKVKPWKGVFRFRKKGKLASRYVGPVEIIERIGLVAYRLRLPEEFNSMHDTFHVLNLKKCLADANLHVPLEEIKIEKTHRFVEEPVEIMDRKDEIFSRRGYCDTRDLIRCMISFEAFDHLILSAFVFGDEYSICSRLVIMERNGVLHAMQHQ
uniref:Putative reverse transcriptase domain-containing protein n=1 Tax=Tanacetum cinerariifolium TaxID=118510 RepID=A0A6L2ME50_TANCI|nr:putative reverse transcriptase domain-containing protein [Tanacetum cinerariifolium]